MKIAIGDIHGKDIWKKLIDRDLDECYFVGDYFDNYEQTPTVTQVRNFKEICAEARKNPKIHLCYGNHDFHYLLGVDRNEYYSGYQFYGRFDIQEVLEENKDILKIIYQSDDYLISHAGVSKTFLKSLNLENTLDINKRFEMYRMSLAFCGHNQYGDDITQGPLWIRPQSLLKDKLDNYKQIVGHTKVDKITTENNITFIDCLDSKIELFEF